MAMLTSLPLMAYRVEDSVESLTSIVTAVVLKRLNIDKTFLYLDAVMFEDETLDAMSYRLYESADYGSIIALVNGIVDPYHLVMNTDLLAEYVTAKYGDANSIHHFFDTRLQRRCDDRSSLRYKDDYARGVLDEYIIPVSNLEYERSLNDARRYLKVVNPRFILTFVDILKATLEGRV